jgi:hypothetical protein
MCNLSDTCLLSFVSHNFTRFAGRLVMWGWCQESGAYALKKAFQLCNVFPPVHLLLCYRTAAYDACIIKSAETFFFLKLGKRKVLCASNVKFCNTRPFYTSPYLIAKSVPLSTHLYVHDEGRPEHVSGTHEYGSCMSVPRLLWRHPRSPGRLWQVSHLNAPSGCGFSMCYNCMQLGLGGNGSQHIFH